MSTKEAIIIDKLMKTLEIFQNKNRLVDLFDEIMDKSV